jgi:glycosyltransferase involved in cell wall biosynthesis
MNIPLLLYPILFYAFCFVIAVQIFYYLFFFARLAFYKASVKGSSQEYPVSVIVCARDEAHNLAKNLPGILVQEYKTTHEIIVVNDNSVDETKYILDEFRKSFKNLNPIPLSQEAKMIPGKKFPLSIGIKSSKYETILLCDADCVPASEHWIQKMQEGYKAGTEIVLGYGAYYKKAGLLNKIIRFETFHSALQYLSFALAGVPYMGVGRNLSYKRELFFKNKGFSAINQIPGGDDDLFINMVADKKNISIVIDKEAHTLSEPKKTWKEWMRQKGRHYTTSKYYKGKHKFLLALYAATNLFVYPLLIASIILYNWWLALSVFGLRLLIQAFVWYKTMRKLNESDLWPYFLLFDLWMFIYYFLFAPALWRKPQKNWN